MTDLTPSVDLDVPRRVLAVGAHPDDIEFGCGATLAKWSAQGSVVHLLVLTDGSKGTWDPAADPAALAATRIAEQDDAARVLGASGVSRTELVDGELTDGAAERAAVCAVIRTVRPDVLLTHDPWKRYRLHPDHRNAGWLTLDAVVAARDPHFFPAQGLDPHRPDRLLLFEAEDVDHYERVASVGAKVDALLAHRSQWRSTMGIDRGTPGAEAQRAAFAEKIRAEAARFGSTIGGGLAEGFKRIDEV
ncbi:MAG: PIG-L family deacetylase [Acidimicrobiia bacterium]|jgi:LmbE family N-acetylglucosaminyl deacetylase